MMRVSAVLAALCAGLASAATTTSIKPGAVTSHIAPQQSPPPGCSPNYSGVFNIGPVNVSSSSTSKRGLAQRDTSLGITLAGGILTDPFGRTGYIASNQQFQFDGPPQAGAIWTAGFSICENGSLALGNDVFWWSCLSGTFYNLYFEKIGGQCIESYIVAYGIDGGHPIAASVTATASTTAASGSTTGSASSSGAGNATMSSSSMAASNSSSSAIGSHNTTMKLTTTKPPPMHTTKHTGGSGGSGGSSAAAQTTSSSTTGSGNAAAPTNGIVGGVLGVAGGLFAFAAML